MTRPVVYGKQAILSKDINRHVDAFDDLFLNLFISRAVPSMPSFIGGSLSPTIVGNRVSIRRGIGFQRVDQPAGSTSSPIRVINLDNDMPFSFSLPSGSNTRKDMIECRSSIVDDGTESRVFKTQTSTENRTVVTAKKWSLEIRVRQGVSADSDGNYNPSVGWVALCIVDLNSGGITSVEDLRNFSNIFDPDFFSLYGRKGLTLHRKFDGVRLIELPFEFSTRVSDIDQISVRKYSRGFFGSQLSTQVGTTNRFTLAQPVQNAQRVALPAQTFDTDGTLKSSQPVFTVRSNNITSLAGASSNWISSTDDMPDLIIVSQVTLEQWLRNVPIQVNDMVAFTLFEEGVRNTAGRTAYALIPDGGSLYVMGMSSATNIIMIWKIEKTILTNRIHQLVLSNTNYENRLQPIYGSVSNNFTHFAFSVSNPITTVPGRQNFEWTGNLAVPNFSNLRVRSLSFVPGIRRLEIKIQDTSVTGGNTAEVDLFDNLKILKGNTTRINLQRNQLSSSASGDTVTYSKTLTSLENLVLDTDSSFNDFSVNFSDVTVQGRQIYRSENLRKNRDFDILTEGTSRHLEIKSSYPINFDDEILVSHIIPQSLIDTLGSDTNPLTGDVEDQLRALQGLITANTNRIVDLENVEGVDIESTVFYGVSAKKTSASQAQDVSIADAETAFNSGVRNQVTSKDLNKGIYFSIAAGASVGFYYPWVAVESSKINTLRFRNNVVDETDLWVLAGSEEVNGKRYRILVRTQPLGESENLQLILKDYV